MRRKIGLLWMMVSMTTYAASVWAIDVPWDGDADGDILISRADGLLQWVEHGAGNIGNVFAGNNQGAGTVQEIDIGDIDFDGNGDILTARDQGALGEVTWTERFGNSLAGQPVAFNVSPANSIAVGELDFDGDGDMILGRNDGFITWVERSGGNVTANHTFNVGGVTEVAIGDLDGDADGDVVSVQPGGNLVWSERTALSTLTGVFNGFNVTPATALEIGDLDNDGDGDIVIGRQDGFVTYAERSGNNITSGVAAPNFNLGSVADLALGDVNGDGDDEIIVAQSALGGSVFVLDQNGLSLSSIAGAFQAVGNADSITSLDVGDLDGDAFLDIVVGRTDGMITWMEVINGGTQITGITSFNIGSSIVDLRIASQVPEPASLALLGMGMATMLLRKRK